MQSHMSDSFHTAAETVNVGEKYKTVCRTMIKPNRATPSPNQVNIDTRRTPIASEGKEIVIMIV